jgi:two-component system response regulator YesN
MKALLVDDEKHVRDAVRLLVDWQHFGVDLILEASNGQIAIELITTEKPEIIITDMMMPGINGAQLLEWVHTHAPASKTIVISGHDDFSLLRHTVKYGGMDYILKPIDAEQLHEALSKATDTWRKEEEARVQSRERNIEMNQLRPVYWDKLLSKLIAEPSYYDILAEQLEKEFDIDRNRVPLCRIAILSMDTMEQSLRNKFSSNMDLLFFSLINICNEFLRIGQRGISFRNGNNENEIILLLWRDLDKAMMLLDEINNGMKITLHSRLDFGIGDTEPFPAGLNQSYNQAYEALRQRNLLSKKAWVHYVPKQERPAKKVLHFSDYEERIRLAIRSGSSEQVQSALQLWIDAVKQLDSITMENLDLWWDEYSVMKRRWIEEFFPTGEETSELQPPKELAGLIIPLDEHGLLSLSIWQQELTRSIQLLAKALLEHQQKEHKTIFDIAKYVENHYNEDLTLQDIANQFYLSREYISRKFKQEFKVNLSDYLGRIRIDKAKLLLLNPHLRIAQIADMVGYQDEKYFSKVFKKLEGVSPNEYRKHL